MLKKIDEATVYLDFPFRPNVRQTVGLANFLCVYYENTLGCVYNIFLIYFTGKLDR